MRNVSYWFNDRFDGFEQGLNNFHIQAKSVGNENMRKSPPNKKTKKTNLDFSLDSPKILSKDSNKFTESSDKFMFLGRATVVQFYKDTNTAKSDNCHWALQYN